MNAAGCNGIGLTPHDSTGGRERQMGLAVYREPLLRGEWKALWRDSDTVPGTVAGAECAGLFDCPDGETVGRREGSCKLKDRRLRI